MSYDIFPMGALGVLGALEGKTVEEMAESLLEEEEQMAKEREENDGKEKNKKTENTKLQRL